MGWFAKLFTPAPAPASPVLGAGSKVVELNDGGRVDVVGESNYQPALEAAVGGRCRSGWDSTVAVTLRLEPKNRFDPNAVQVFAGGQVVGYLGRADAVAYRRALLAVEKAGAVATCEGRIVGGWDRGDGDFGHFGIWLDLARPELCLPYED